MYSRRRSAHTRMSSCVHRPRRTHWAAIVPMRRTVLEGMGAGRSGTVNCACRPGRADYRATATPLCSTEGALDGPSLTVNPSTAANHTSTAPSSSSTRNTARTSSLLPGSRRRSCTHHPRCGSTTLQPCSSPSSSCSASRTRSGHSRHRRGNCSVGSDAVPRSSRYGSRRCTSHERDSRSL